MQCSFTSWNSLKCHSRKNLNCQAHQYMKLNAGLSPNSNSKMIFMSSRIAREQDSRPTLKKIKGNLKGKGRNNLEGRKSISKVTKNI